MDVGHGVSTASWYEDNGRKIQHNEKEHYPRISTLVIAGGSGADARKVMGMALFSGMTLATLLDVLLYLMLYVFIG